jgi:predicted dehydrogenase
MRNLGSHALHLLVHLFGEVEELVADDSQLLHEWRFPNGSVVHPETNDFANLILRHTGGMTMQLQVSWSATVGRGWHFEAFGSEGRITASDPSFPTSQNTMLSAGAIGSKTVDPIEIPDRLMRPTDINIGPDAFPQAAHPMAISMQRMVHAIHGDWPAAPDFAQAWHVERILEAARLSSQERKWMRLDTVG